MVVVCRDPAIAKVHGVTSEPVDRSYVRLQNEAFDFLNDILRRFPTFDKAAIQAEARQLWHDIASGTETYEVGAAMYTVRFKAPRTAIQLGPNLQLRRIEGQWAAERFALTRPLPTDRWALSATITRERGSPSVQPWLEADDPNEAAVLERGLLPLRLVRPTAIHPVIGTYRIGVAGYRKPPVLRHIDRDVWRDFGGSTLWRAFSKSEVTSLIEIGSILAQLTTPDDFLGHDESDLLKLALRAFNGAAQRRQWQDRTVDYAVALEAMFGRDKTDITYKTAIRAGLLLGLTEAQGVRIFEVVRGFYDLRSGVVHANLGQRKNGATRTVTAWRGAKNLPQAAEVRASAASSIGSEIVAVGLCAFLRLEAAGYKPFEQKFLADLDLSTFRSSSRRAIQRAAGIRAK